VTVAGLSQSDYERLLGFRTALRRFLRWSEEEARAAGLTPAQHQLLLAIRGHPDGAKPTVGELSEYLVLRHHSVVELIDRAEVAGLVRRLRDPSDHRVVRLQLSAKGRRRIEKLSALHLEELRRLAPALRGLGEADGR
jgi:DNA-binding MarR family transcriptional regulator